MYCFHWANTCIFNITSAFNTHLTIRTFPNSFILSDLYPLDSIPDVPNPNHPLYLPDVAWNPWTDIRDREDVMALNLSFPYGPVPAAFRRFIRQSYYAATSYMDAQVGRLLAAVEDDGMVDNTIILLVGDHGGLKIIIVLGCVVILCCLNKCSTCITIMMES